MMAAPEPYRAVSSSPFGASYCCSVFKHDVSKRLTDDRGYGYALETQQGRAESPIHLTLERSRKGRSGISSDVHCNDHGWQLLLLSPASRWSFLHVVTMTK